MTIQVVDCCGAGGARIGGRGTAGTGVGGRGRQLRPAVAAEACRGREAAPGAGAVAEARTEEGS